ncbi:MAG TPA: trypsin-like peptidase domain-containing protein [bacterium]|nr:trypsin-like peptidase domain-containing protein [bacterium]
MPRPRTAGRLAAGTALALALLTALLLSAAAIPARADTAPSFEGESVEDAVVDIIVTSQHGDWYSPWQEQRPQQASGSGFLIEGHRILTNAHVVSDARQILVRRSGQTIPYFARVEFIAHDSDLALLRVDDPAFDQGVTPLALGDLPSLRSHVRTYGFPAGGDHISRTEGVVSRVQFITYLHSGVDSHLGVQTDSAINPGNSGGPVLQEGKVIGVAFQASRGLSGVGYFIPTPVIKRFLRDIADGRYDGYAELGINASNLLNPMYRDYLGLPPGAQGVTVDNIMPGASADGLVHRDDVVLAIDHHPIGLDGTIEYFGHQVSYEQIAEEKQIGQSVSLTLWRDRHQMQVEVPLKALPHADRIRLSFDAQPSYYIYAGLVFMPLDLEFLSTFGNYWQIPDKQLLAAHFFKPTEDSQDRDPDRVVLTRILPSPVNQGYRDLTNTLVESVNGQKVRTLMDLDRALSFAQGPYQRIILQPGEVEVVLDRRAAQASAQEILSLYGVPKDRRLP